MSKFLQRFFALVLLVLPPWVAVKSAILFADKLYAPIEALLAPTLDTLNALPSLPAALLAGDYGVVAMLPFLFLYAMPTAVLFAVLTQAYRSSGLLERLSHLLHPWTVKIGLQGEDLVKIHMGFGCNVPALHAARSCHSCTREACMSAIAFGAACSYQHPASLSVLAAAGRPELSIFYLSALVGATVLFLRLFYGGAKSQASGLTSLAPSTAMAWPGPGQLLKAGWVQSVDFVKDVAGVFLGVCLLAALAAWAGLLGLLDRAAAPLMTLLHLPEGVGPAVVLSAVRKNGMASVLVDPAGGLKVPLSSDSQLLGAILLAGMVVPCVVTALALGKSLGWKRTSFLLVRQIFSVFILVACITWGGALLGL